MINSTCVAHLQGKVDLFDEFHYPIFSTIQKFCEQCPFAKEQYCRPAIMNELIVTKVKQRILKIALMIFNVGQEINIVQI